MRKKSVINKGFTLIELVIVIAVIAILAGVLIPTFSNIIEKSNASNDINLIRNINEVLVINSADNEVPHTKDEFRNVINEYGITDFKNKAKNHIFYYIKEDNISVIWGIEEQRIIYPEYYNFNGNINNEINLSSNEVVNQVDYATVYNTYGYCDKYKDNSRLKDSAKDITSIGSGGYVATGIMSIDTNKYNELSIYVSGCIYDGNSFSAIHLIIDDKLHELRKIKAGNDFLMDNNNNTDYEVHLKVEEISESYYKIIITNYNEIKEYINDKTISFATSLYGVGKDLIITFNEEIYR